jgi:hypothetical protein
MPETRTLTLEVTVPSEAYETMVGALCRAGGFSETSDANARSTVLAWARATVQNVLAGDAERIAAEAVAAEKAKADAVLDTIQQLSASQLEGVTSRDPEPIIEEVNP